MKKIFITLTVLVLFVGLILSSCGEEATETTSATPATTSPATSASPSPTTPAVSKYGGHLRIITGAGTTPQNIGYYPKQQFGDATITTIWADRILNLKTTGDFAPNVAEGYETSADVKTITIHLRKDVIYQDDTPMNAQSVLWSFEDAKNAGILSNGKYIDKMEATDDYTLKIYLNAPNNQVIYNLARVYLFSPTAYEKNGEDWAINHSVSTGPFVITDFQRDVVVKMDKFDGYWRKGYPYLDSVEILTVKDPTTAAAMMQAGQADIWMGSPAQQTADLQKMGFSVTETPTTYNTIYCDSTDPSSPFAIKEVREAIEYAIDRQSMADALGFGFQIAVEQPSHPGTSGYDPNFPVRNYDPEKARQLLADAGFGTGIKTTLLIMQGAENAGAIVQNFLAEIGIDAEIDIADVGRFWGSINGGWHGLLLGPYAVNPEYSVAWLDHFGPEPIMQFKSMAKSPEYLDLCAKLITAPDITTMRDLTRQMVAQAGLDVMFIPMTLNMGTSTYASNFVTSYYKDLDWTYWTLWDDYLEQK
jgi:peptide/nickel transport system substrate-binding protein